MSARGVGAPVRPLAGGRSRLAAFPKRLDVAACGALHRVVVVRVARARGDAGRVERFGRCRRATRRPAARCRRGRGRCGARRLSGVNVRIDNRAARRLLLHLYGLSAPPRRKLDADGLLALIRAIGFVQLDSISTVARAHHMILLARNQTYRPDLLTALLEQRRDLFEAWTHDASVVPAGFWPYWQPRFERDRRLILERWRKWRSEPFEHEVEGVLEHVRDNGPVMARELKPDGKRGAPGWWDWHPSKTALEFLWRTGKLAVARRQGFQKVYGSHRAGAAAGRRAARPSGPDRLGLPQRLRAHGFRHARRACRLLGQRQPAGGGGLVRCPQRRSRARGDRDGRSRRPSFLPDAGDDSRGHGRLAGASGAGFAC